MIFVPSSFHLSGRSLGSLSPFGYVQGPGREKVRIIEGSRIEGNLVCMGISQVYGFLREQRNFAPSECSFTAYGGAREAQGGGGGGGRGGL